MSISSLEAELSRQKSINRELRSELAEVESGVRAGYNTLEDCNRRICETLDASADKLQDSHSMGLGSIETQHEIEDLYVRFKQMELANKKIRECNNRKYYEFADYRTVRKQVQGMMDNLDVHLVSDNVIYKSVEKEHLKRPDYWLTCVLIAIMAWKNDDRPLAERAIEQAVKLNKKNSSVFFMLFNIRMHRDEAALKWFFAYQECPLKGADQHTFLMLFALLSKTVKESQDINDETRKEIQAFIQRVVQECTEAEGYSNDDMVAMARNYYDRMDGREAPAYPKLRKHCGSFQNLSFAMRKAQGNVNILQFVKTVAKVDEIQRNAYVKRFIEDLVAEANDMEKSVYDEIRYNEMIIESKGDVEAAKARFKAEQKHDETQLNLVSEMIQWIFSGSEEEVNAQSRLNMYHLTMEIQKDAIHAHTQAYRAVEKNKLPITIDDYSTTVDFSQNGSEDQKIGDFYRQKRDEALAGIKDTMAYVAFAAAAAGAVAAIAVNPVLLVVTLVGIGWGVMTLLGNRSQRSALQLNCDNQIQAVTEVMHCLFEEHRQYLEELAGYDAYAERIDAELAAMG